jgi:hypothetical protein
MKPLRSCGDSRNKEYCVHCCGPDETRDHVPSKVLLDEFYLENLPVCPSCLKCNNASSADEWFPPVSSLRIGHTVGTLRLRITVSFCGPYPAAG